MQTYHVEFERLPSFVLYEALLESTSEKTVLTKLRLHEPRANLVSCTPTTASAEGGWKFLGKVK